MTNGLFHPYHLDESMFNYRGIRSDFTFFDENHVSKRNSPSFATSHLELFCLPMSHTKDARIVWVNSVFDVLSGIFIVITCFIISYMSSSKDSY